MTALWGHAPQVENRGYIRKAVQCCNLKQKDICIGTKFKIIGIL